MTTTVKSVFELPVSIADGGTGATDAAAARTALGITIGGRDVDGTSGEIVVTNSDGSTGNPTISLAANPVLPGAQAVTVPKGDTAERPGAPAGGEIRYNTDTSVVEIYSDSDWLEILPSTGVQVNLQIFTASGTYTPLAEMKYCIVEVIGGGGGGGGVSSSAGSSAAAGGGGAGAYSKSLISAAAIGASQVVTIGAGGAGGAAGVNDGSPGGQSSLGVLASADGGAGGIGANHSVSFSYGVFGAGGGAGVGDILVDGQNGGLGQSFGSNLLGYGGAGGSSFYGVGGSELINQAGQNGFNYGSGGSGASSANTGNAAGGNGSDGIIIITEFV